ncbi:MAG TPA: penicillin-insensitive murein endopeptidase, partial [Kofleriaceae bacterium]
MKLFVAMLAVSGLASGLAGCAELGMITDGGSASIGKPSKGSLVDGVRVPDSGEGFTTREIWRARGNRYGTAELVDLIVGTGRRMARTPGQRIVVADLSSQRGGDVRKWHKAHQSGRDVDLVYFMRDATGASMEADAMRVFDRDGVAKDSSGITIDMPRTWELMRALLTGDEATVQWIFMYQPFADRLIEYGASIGESEELLARAKLVMKQPGDSARHDDHIHVRIYCSPRDLLYGCVDIGPMEPMAERIASRERGESLPRMVASMLSDLTVDAIEDALHPTTKVLASSPMLAGSSSPNVSSLLDDGKNVSTMGDEDEAEVSRLDV